MSCESNRDNVFHRERTTRCNVTKAGLESDFCFAQLPKGKCLKNPGERAVLIQTMEHYEDLRSEFEQLPGHFDGDTAAFGENLIVKGMSADTLCVGDIIRLDNSPLVLQIKFPRLACMRPDKLHPTGMRSGTEGTVRQFVSSNGRGGFFCEVLVPGPVGDGDVFRLDERVLPAWTLARIASMCYPKTPLKITWGGTADELSELIASPVLGDYEWKERLREVFQEIAGKAPASAKARIPIAPEAMCGDGSLEHVGIKMEGNIECLQCNQKFCTHLALDVHMNFFHVAGDLCAASSCRFQHMVHA